MFVRKIHNLLSYKKSKQVKKFMNGSMENWRQIYTTVNQYIEVTLDLHRSFRLLSAIYNKFSKLKALRN